MFNTIRKWLAPSGQAEVSSHVRQWHDAASTATRLKGWTAPSTAFSTNLGSGGVLRDRARDGDRNNPIARAIVQRFQDDAIGGTGIRPQFGGPYKAAARELWATWEESADFGGRDMCALQALALQTFVVDGEFIARTIPAGDLSVPMQIQLLGCEFMDSTIVGDRDLNGIAYDADGRRAGYHLYAKHPATAPNMASSLVPQLGPLSPFGAVHVHRTLQPGVERGVSLLAPAMLALQQLRTYMEAQLTKQEISALFCGFAISPDGSNPLTPQPGQSGGFTASMEPGTFALLNGTQSVEFSDSPQAGDFDPFVKAQLRLIASAVGMPYELLANDVSAVTFASGRHSILAYRRRLEGLQYNVMVAGFLAPVLRAWLRLALATGALPGTIADYPVRWIAPVVQALDPRQEVQSDIARVRAGFMPRSEIVAREGWDSEVIDSEIASDNARADRLGNVYDSDPRKVTAQGQEQQSTQA
jgi:lambda family phage portal protein